MKKRKQLAKQLWLSHVDSYDAPEPDLNPKLGSNGLETV